MRSAEIPAETGRVTTQAPIIPPSSLQLRDPCFLFSFLLIVFPYAQPTNATAPTLQCVVEIGTPTLLAMRTVNADPVSTVTPL